MVLTEFPNLQDLTKHPGELNGTAPKGTLVFIFSTAVLQNNLQEQDATHTKKSCRGVGICKNQQLHIP